MPDSVAKCPDSVANWRQSPKVTLSQNTQFLYYCRSTFRWIAHTSSNPHASKWSIAWCASCLITASLSCRCLQKEVLWRKQRETSCAVRILAAIWRTTRVHTCLNLSFMRRTATRSERSPRRSASFSRWTTIRYGRVRVRWSSRSLNELRAAVAVASSPSRVRRCAVIELFSPVI